MRVSVRVSHRGWKMATRVARLAIGVPDYEAHLLPRGEDAVGAEPAWPEPPPTPRWPAAPRSLGETERGRAEVQG
jgi:diadenosine tetraphosphate (Ap4A) HIT family hydrolase